MNGMSLYAPEATQQRSQLMEKMAAGGNETEFEQAFSSLAYAYLRDKAPRLLDNMLGFQLVERNDDNTKAMGVFGFQIGNQLLMAPVFFLNGDLKGHELLYLKNNDSFVPLEEGWVNYVMGRKPHVIGEPSVNRLRDLGGVYPDVRSLSIPPTVGGGKRASDNSWFEEFKPVLAACRAKYASFLFKEAGDSKLNMAEVVKTPFSAALAKSAAAFDFNKLMLQYPGLLKAAHKVSEAYPLIKKGFYQFYGTDCFMRWGREIHSKLVDQAANIMPEEKKAQAPYMPGFFVLPQPRPQGPVDHVKEGALKLYKQEHIFTNKAKELDEKERARLLKDTKLIKDHRKGIQVTRTYNTQIEAKLTNPMETGIYRVLEKPGSFDKMVVLKSGIGPNGPIAGFVVVRPDSGDHCIAHGSRVFADQVADRSEWDEWFDSLPKKQELAKGGKYIAVGENGACSAPFTVSKKIADGHYHVDFDTYTDERRPDYMPRHQEDDCWKEKTYSNWNADLYVGAEGKKGTTIKTVAGAVRVPDNCKIWKLKSPRKYESEADSLLGPISVKQEEEDKPIDLGRIEDIHTLFYEKTAGIKLQHTGTDVYVTSPLGQERVGHDDATWHLMSVHGMTEKAAEELLSIAEKKGVAECRVEYAPGYGTMKMAAPNHSMLEHGPDAPLYDDYVDLTGVEQYGPRTAANTIHGGDFAYRLQHMSADQTDPAVWDNWQNYEAQDFQQNAQQAQQAASSGQKEIFDVSVFAAMAKRVNIDSMIEKFLGSLMDCLDSLGRLLLSFYWHGEEFQDRYGKADMPELEDGIRNSFEAVGTLALYLRERELYGDAGDDGPDLDSLSRN